MKQFRALLASGLVWVAVAAWAAYALTSGFDLGRLETLVISSAIVLFGEVLEIEMRGGRLIPVSGAVVLALFVVLQSPLEVVVAVAPAFAAGIVLRGRHVGWAARFRSTSRRLGTMTLALLAYSWLISVLPIGTGDRMVFYRTGVMVGVGFLQLFFDAAASALLIAHAQKIPARPLWRSQVQNRLALHGAFLSVAALMALAYEVLREAALVLFMLPLLAARYSFRRYASIHKTYEQTIRALSRVPELAGYSSQSHGLRIADIATAIARDQGLSDHEVKDIEFAALLHNIGVLAFDDPMEVPESVAGTPKGRSLGAASAGIVTKAPYLKGVARILEFQDAPFIEEIPAEASTRIGARIVKVANDFVELTEPGGPRMPPARALAHLEARSGFDYEPAVLKALRRVLEHRQAI